MVPGDWVYAAAWHDWVQALDIATGQLLWNSYVPISIEALSYYRDRLYVRAPTCVMELDPATGNRLRLGHASYGYGGLAFLEGQMFLSGIQSQYGTSGGLRTDLDGPDTPMARKVPTLEGVRMLKQQGPLRWPALASMGAPLAAGEAICFAAVSGEVIVTARDGKRLWAANLGAPCHSSPVAAGGLLVVGADDGVLYACREKR